MGFRYGLTRIVATGLVLAGVLCVAAVATNTATEADGLSAVSVAGVEALRVAAFPVAGAALLALVVAPYALVLAIPLLAFVMLLGVWTDIRRGRP